MHNCKFTKERLIDLAVDELPQPQREQLLAELRDCAQCREEFASIREALFVSKQVLAASTPPENFWNGYHNRLVARLAEQPVVVSSTESLLTRLWIRVRNAATASVRVPAPVAVAMALLLFAVTSLLAWNSKKQQIAVPANSPTVITRTVTVPVPQEKIVTRIVYRTRFRPQVDQLRLQSSDPRRFPGVVAHTDTNNGEKSGISLVGFKPTDRVKLQVMKGSYRDEQ
jgi:anti-sigma factor RsiW